MNSILASTRWWTAHAETTKLFSPSLGSHFFVDDHHMLWTFQAGLAPTHFPIIWLNAIFSASRNPFSHPKRNILQIKLLTQHINHANLLFSSPRCRQRDEKTSKHIVWGISHKFSSLDVSVARSHFQRKTILWFDFRLFKLLNL